MVRSPCCDKTKVKKGPWSHAEDSRLISYIQQFGHSNWRALPQQAGLLRCGKSCRLRWINYLRPDVKRGNLSPEEEETIIRLHKTVGNCWSRIASQLPGRTDNEIKNVWNTYLKKKAYRLDDAATRHENKSKDSLMSYSSSPSPSSGSCISYGEPNNLDKGPVIQEALDSLAQCNPIDEPKEELVSPGPCNIASNVQSLVSRPMEDTAPLLHSTNGASEVQNVIPTEPKQGMVSDESVENIPFDSDFEFWSMLDSLVHTEPTEFQPQEPEVSKPDESTNSGGDAECKKWLKYLENELGLAGGTDSDCPQYAAAKELGMTASDNELMFSPEIYPAKSFFSTWPSPPQDFGF